VPFMKVDSVYVIEWKGLVLAGILEGEGQLHVGDVASFSDERWDVVAIERFGATLTSADPGAAIGVVLDGAADGSGLAGCTVQFSLRPSQGVPALTEGGWPVPDQAVLVGWSARRRAFGQHFAALILDGLEVRLAKPDGTNLVDATGTQLHADAVGSIQVALRAPGGVVRYLVGPVPEWAKRGAGAAIVERFDARLLPDLRLAGEEEGRLWKLAVTQSGVKLRFQHLWQAPLLAMLRTRGVTPAAGGSG
jgi:hypothetical protein